MRNKTLLIIAGLFVCIGCCAQGISYADLPSGYSGEVYYRSHTKTIIRDEPDSLVAVFYKGERGYLYFRPITQPKTYIMVSKKRYKHISFKVGDTVVYNNRPDVYYRVTKQTTIRRNVRRFKR